MKVLKTLLVVAGVMLLASTVSAQFCGCPEDHIPYQRWWRTNDGSLLPGRVSETWCGKYGYPVMPGVPGNTEYAQSWDGANLGTQWELWGMEIDAAGAGETDRYFDEHGNGYIDYVTNYTGGRFWLSGAHFGPPGSVDFEGILTYFNVGTRVSYTLGEVTGVTSNVLLNGWMTETCECCYIEFAIANAIRVWVEGEGAPPVPYPPFICDENKTPGGTGELFDACCITVSISCPNSGEESSWGAIKQLLK
jgi:hypothetical protein